MQNLVVCGLVRHENRRISAVNGLAAQPRVFYPRRGGRKRETTGILRLPAGLRGTAPPVEAHARQTFRMMSRPRLWRWAANVAPQMRENACA